MYRLDTSTIPEESAAVADGEVDNLVTTLVTILRDSELALKADGTFEWKSFFLRDQTGRWAREGDVVTIQPAGDSDGVPATLSFRLGTGTLTLISTQDQEPIRRVIMLRRE